MKNIKKKVEEFIRVDHAGERGAVKIYEGQLLALNTIVKDDDLKKTIEEIANHLFSRLISQYRSSFLNIHTTQY